MAVAWSLSVRFHRLTLAVAAVLLAAACSSGLAQTLTTYVPSDGRVVVMQGMTPGAMYQLRISGWMTFGTWQVNGRTLQNDACYEFSAKGYADPLPVLTNDAGVITCGAYASDHVYTSAAFAAQSSSMRFWVIDSDYRDNSGALLVEMIPVRAAAASGRYCVLRNQDLYGPPVCYQFYLADTTRTSGAMAVLDAAGGCMTTDLATRQGWEVDPTLGGPFTEWEAGDQAMSSLSRYGGDVYGCIAAQATWNDADDDATRPDASNSCMWAFDGECDEPGIGTGVCDAGTDAADCSISSNDASNSCMWAFDGECDEPGIGTGVCDAGTDAADCSVVSNDRSNSCMWAFDGECDEPGIGTGVCDAGTDAADCASAVPAPTIDLPDDVEERDQTLSECDAWSASNSGGVEGTIDTWDISTIPSGAVFDLRYDAHDVPDAFRISYRGAMLWDSGWRGSSSYASNPIYSAGIVGEGQGEILDLFTKTSANEFRVTVIGGESGTGWDYQVRCRRP